MTNFEFLKTQQIISQNELLGNVVADSGTCAYIPYEFCSYPTCWDCRRKWLLAEHKVCI
ncbi:MAG: hypothetical protein RR338_00260 [Clostridia bacterium]